MIWSVKILERHSHNQTMAWATALACSILLTGRGKINSLILALLGQLPLSQLMINWCQAAEARTQEIAFLPSAVPRRPQSGTAT